MGDPRRLKKKYRGPRHLWQKARIDEEKKILKSYGLKNKTEIWKANSQLRSITKQAKKLLADNTKQGEKEKALLLKKLQRLSLIKTDQGLDDVLGLKLTDFLERRLQTLLVKKGLARTISQARQMIAHNHVNVGGKNVTSPSYFVSATEEEQITFAGNSSFANSEHPERTVFAKPGAKNTKEVEQ